MRLFILLRSPRTIRLFLFIILGAALIVSVLRDTGQRVALAQTETGSVTGTVIDVQGQGVCEAEVELFTNNSDEPLDSTTTYCEDGVFVLSLKEVEAIQSLRLHISHPHFEWADWEATRNDVALINAGHTLALGEIVLDRHIGVAFWIATATFVLVLLLIALEKLHNTLAALMGVGIVLVTSAVGTFIPSLYIFGFEHALSYVDFEVVFLVMGMMIVIAAIEGTGVFQWVTYQAYRLSGGRVWLLVIILMFITAIASALLDNVTTMLLMAPLTIQIALALGVNPVSLLIPEVLASNVGGIATLIGTPTNILIGSYAGLGFNDFVMNLTPGVLLAQLVLIAFIILRYGKRWSAATGGGLSEALLNRLAEAGKIREPVKLRKASIVFAVTILGFVLGENIHLAPAVVAIVGAVLMLLWVAPDIETMMKLVDWTTLMFFIALFILVGAIQEVGLLSVVAGGISQVVGDSLWGAALMVIWSAALLSGLIDNIPFAAAMLPVVGYLTRTIPGADNMLLFYCLSVGAAMGGNTTLIGASANLVTAGIAERAGYKISYMNFLKVGVPATLLTVAVGTGWLLLHFHVLAR
nr:ArsB/NhaD family transporter [Anaerolineae bacterium]